MDREIDRMPLDDGADAVVHPRLVLLYRLIDRQKDGQRDMQIKIDEKIDRKIDRNI